MTVFVGSVVLYHKRYREVRVYGLMDKNSFAYTTVYSDLFVGTSPIKEVFDEWTTAEYVEEWDDTEYGWKDFKYVMPYDLLVNNVGEHR